MFTLANTKNCECGESGSIIKPTGLKHKIHEQMSRQDLYTQIENITWKFRKNESPLESSPYLNFLYKIKLNYLES
jgi:hypothetical protein